MTRPSLIVFLAAALAIIISAGCATLPQDFDRTESHAFTDTQNTIFGELLADEKAEHPGKPGTAYLTWLAKRGVRVRILTNSLASNDVGIVHSGYMKYRKELLQGGVELYEMNKKLTREQRKEKQGTGGSSKASLHAKSFVFDRQQVFIGSLNLDPRALVHNTEIGVVLEVPEIARGMAKWFDENIEQHAFRLELKKLENGYEKIYWHGWEKGQQVVYTHEPYTGFWRRLSIGFMSILPIESQL